MIRLLDVNVLVALAWPTHEHHVVASRWFEEVGADGWATCPLTQLGFVRVSSNPAFSTDAVSPSEATARLDSATAVGRYEFWPDDLPLTSDPVPLESLQGHHQITDAYLAALAEQHRGKLATLDARLARSPVARGVTELIAAR